MARDVLVALLDIEDPHAGDAARTTSGSVGYTPKLRNPGKMAGAIHVAHGLCPGRRDPPHPLEGSYVPFVGHGHRRGGAPTLTSCSSLWGRLELRWSSLWRWGVALALTRR